MITGLMTLTPLVVGRTRVSKVRLFESDRQETEGCKRGSNWGFSNHHILLSEASVRRVGI